MKVFIAWSGKRSETIATVLKDWLPLVVPGLEIFMSTEDIRSGARWITDIGSQLQQARFGLLCITPENRGSTWIHFEAGALSKEVETAHVCPLLFGGLQPSNIEYPIAQFQGHVFSQPEMRKLAHDLNELRTPPLAAPQVDRYFESYWPELAAEVGQALERVPDGGQVVPRSTDDMMPEVLTILRQIERAIAQMERQRSPAEELDEIRRAGAVVAAMQEFRSLAALLQIFVDRLRGISTDPSPDAILDVAARLDSMRDMLRDADRRLGSKYFLQLEPLNTGVPTPTPPP